jgi:hypothetical protein
MEIGGRRNENADNILFSSLLPSFLRFMVSRLSDRGSLVLSFRKTTKSPPMNK